MYFPKLLIANRGEIAVRIIRACHELGIAAVAVYSEADRRAMHVRLADEAYLIGPSPAAESYLRADRVVDAALRSGATAIHPGYGFLSERAHFARACRAAGITFVGPSAEAIELLGSKIAAKRLAIDADVPTAPAYLGDDQTPEQLAAEAEQIGFPLLIKASAGGGGKGMRVVRGSADFYHALQAAKREAQAAFGDDAVLLEKLIERPRHVEIQVLCDTHGNGVSLFERECSIQRRHQKILEESPSPALSPDVRAAMGAAAVRLALRAGYTNAGTVEFVLDAAGQPYFLEMNTRLQVEHPVTEAVTGLDLVKLQLAIAAGEPLPFAQADLAQRGHAIEVRVYAEDSVRFLPSIGTVAVFAPPSGPGIRNDAGIESGDEVTVHYDPMLAKLIVSAADRPSAVDRLQQALADYAVLGVTTNVPLLQAIAANQAFRRGETTTAFLDEHDLAHTLAEPQSLPAEVLLAAAVRDAEPLPSISADPWSAGTWRLAGLGRRLRYHHGDQTSSVELEQTGDTWQVATHNQTFDVRVIADQPSRLILEISRQSSQGDEEKERQGKEDVGLRLSSLGSGPPETTDNEQRVSNNQPINERFYHAANLIHWRGRVYTLDPVAALNIDNLGVATNATNDAGLDAPMPGTVVTILVQEGQTVEAGQPLVVLEAMKMEHVVAAPHPGTVRKLPFAAGALVPKGATLVELQGSKNLKPKHPNTRGD